METNCINTNFWVVKLMRGKNYCKIVLVMVKICLNMMCKGEIMYAARNVTRVYA